MSVSRLQLEQELRLAEDVRELDDLRRANVIRDELQQPEPRRPGLNMLQIAAYDEAAREIARWWRSCRRFGRTELSDAKVRALARRIRGLGRRRK